MRSFVAAFFGAVLLVCLSSQAADPVAKKPELFLMLPEPRAMGSSISKPWAEALRTVLTPAKQIAEKPGIRAYTTDEFAKLGISWDKFLEKAQAVAEKRLASLQPELKKDEGGKVSYAVYRSEESDIAGLIVAPSLGKVFESVFGKEVWVVAPDRHSLFVFPSSANALGDFAADLKERFEDNPYAASEEIFALKSDGSAPRVVGSFNGR